MGDGQSIQIAEAVELKTDPRFQRSAWQEKKVNQSYCWNFASVLKMLSPDQGDVHSTIYLCSK